MKTLGISLMLILLSGSLVSPIGVLFAFATDHTAPLPPTQLNATTVSGTQIFLIWDAPINATQDGVSGYKIEMKPSCSGSFNFLVNTTITSFLSTGLASGTCYQFRVSAINSVGTGSPSHIATATTLSVPSAPANLVATPVSSSRINLSWSAPSNNGGTPVTEYKLEYKTPTTSYSAIMLGNVTKYNQTGLVTGTTYIYRVSAINAIGTSLASNNATATTLSAPSAPAHLVATPVSSSRINLSWSAPSNNGGTPITGYEIERKNACAGSFVVLTNTTNSSTLYSDTGLIANTCYLYRVSAINAIGTSSPSAEAIAITNSSLTHVPSAPTGLLVTTISNATLKLTWHLPSNSGDSKITGYLIQRNGTIVVINTLTNQTNFTNTNLLPYHKETYRVAAWNSAGLGAFSNSASGITANSTTVSPLGTSGSLTGTGALSSNLGQLISDFVHNRNALLKQERADILNAIHQCRAEIKNASQDGKEQIGDECKAKIKALREKYKESRKQIQEEFKQLKELFKLQIQDEKIKLENATNIAGVLGKEIKQSEKENEQSEKDNKPSSNSISTLEKEMKQINKELKKNKGESKENKKRNHNQED